MGLENILVLTILGIAVVLFISEKLSIDLIALLVLLALTLTGLITPEEAFSGFASPAVVTVWSIFIISGGLVRSGVAETIAAAIVRLAGDSQLRLTALIMLGVGVMSAFMNNIGAVAILLPAVVSASHKLRVAPSKLLIPLAWASLLGGNMTLIGTPPNILASSILDTYQRVPSLSFFEFTPMGLIVLSTGVIYMLLIGRRLLPERTPGGDLANEYPIREYLTEVRILPESPLAGRTLRESGLSDQLEINVIQINTNGPTLYADSDRKLREGDFLLIEAPTEAIIKAGQVFRLGLPASGKLTSGRWQDTTDGLKLAEVTLAPRSTLNGLSLREMNFRARFGLSVMAIRREGQTYMSRFIDIPLHFGDALLIEGPSERVDLLRGDTNFMVLDMPQLEVRRTRKAPLAVLILLGVIVSITTGLLSVSTAMLTGAVLMVLSQTLSMTEAYEAIEWKSVFLIAGMLPLGLAMENTGTARMIATTIVDVVGGFGPSVVMMGIFLITALLTEVMSNAAATVLLVPIAIDAAIDLSVDPRTFVLAVVLAASTSFLMPIGHQVNVIIYGPGGYKFSDYTRVGVWLNIILFIVVWLTLPIVWPFN
jgi:di/tricarboxylate transporter